VILDSLFDAKLASVADQISGIEHVLVTGPADYLGNAVTDSQIQPLADKHVTAFMDFLQHGPDEPSQVSYSPADACFIQYTGGTTGPSKGAILTHRNIVANMMMLEHWMKFERGNEVWLTAFPLFHIAGLFVSSCALTLGSTQILIPNPRDLDHIIKECKQKKPVMLGNVPSLYLVLLGKNEFRSLDFSGLRYCLSGAAPFPLDAMKDLESVVGEGKIIEVWGMTETSPLITVIPSRGKKKFGSVGLPLPSTSLRVVDLVDGESPVPLSEEGELICSGPQVTSGYLNKPEETKAALREHDGRVWMHTGDIGKMDEDGFVYVVDRLKDMIIVGGFKVFSSEVEDKFYKHPAVGMCALIGVPNPERPGNEIVKLVLQKSEAYKDKPDSEVEAELLAFAKEKLAPYKVPKIFEFVDAVPTTSVGKVDKKAIRK
jgi:acyl-CoA synthetase (AMP-forming)/AMP-acid ligase II